MLTLASFLSIGTSLYSYLGFWGVEVLNHNQTLLRDKGDRTCLRLRRS
jgi:hypothetical protein